MSRSPRTLLNHWLRHDLASFIQRCVQTVAPGTPYRHNWHIEVIAWHLERCLAGEITRLIVTLPPRSLKSICTSVAFPAWALGLDPSLRFICGSYSGDLAAKHARDCRAVVESPWYRDLFPAARIDSAKNSEFEFATRQRGFRLATSVGGTLTGRGGTCIIIDDPMKADQAASEAQRTQVIDWFTNTAMSRLDNKRTGRIIVVMQRLHADDLAGYLIDRQSGWVHLNLPAMAEADQWFDLGDGRIVGRRNGEALHPEWESTETLEQLRRTLGSHVYEAQYQQNPLPLDGGLINWSWFRTYEDPPDKQPGDLIVQSWDTASKGDEVHSYSVCTTWLRRGDDHYLLDVCRRRLEYPALRKLVTGLARQHGAEVVLIEDKASGTQLIQELRSTGSFRVEAIQPEGDKSTRMYIQTAKLEAGRVHLPRRAPWLDDFQRELLQYPVGRYWDQIDSVSQYLGWRSPVELGPEHFWSNDESAVIDEWGLTPSADLDPSAPWNLFG